MSNLTYEKYLFQISNDINKFYLIFQSAIGIPANLLSIVIFTRLMRNKTNMGYLYLWQSVVDLCALLSFIFLFQSGQTLGINLYIVNDSWCRFITFFRRFIHHFSSWLSVFTTFDRLIFVLYGHIERFKFLKKKRYLTLCIFSILIVNLLIVITNLFYYVKNKNSCTGDYIITISSDIITILMRTYIPFALMVIFNVLMIKKTISYRSRINKLKSVHLPSQVRHEYQFTIAVIAYDVFFLVFNFPRSLYLTFYDVNLYSGAFDGNPLFLAMYSVINAVATNFATFVQAYSFLVYFAFNRLYRRELLYLISKVFHMSSCLQRVYPSSKPPS